MILFLAVLVVAETVLIAVTWPLWTGRSAVPAVPLIASLQPIPLSVDLGLTLLMVGLMVVGSVVIAASRTRADALTGPFSRLLIAAVWLAAAVLTVLNQHRLQPWHWLFLLMLGQWLTRRSRTLPLWRHTLVTIYVCAALSRFGPDMDSGMSLRMVRTAADGLDLFWLRQSPLVTWWACVVINVFELLVGLGLLLPNTRRWAVRAGMLMHLLLLLLLGPMGLHQHWGVLIWNGFLLVGLPLLFSSSATEDEVNRAGRCGWGNCWRVVIWVVPLSGLFGLADNWIAWQVYSPRPESLQLWIHQSSAGDVSEELRPWLQPPAPLEEWRLLRLDRWVLQECQAPVYPEDRFQTALVAHTVRDLPAGAYRIVMEAPGRFRWWRRQRYEFQSVADLRSAAGPFVLNAGAVRE